ncbi:P-II family nitrogen regulator [Tessaracoccus sp. SD287]|uniref:P-II family nitrogen regulator n=1 Tax=Tessaracoccus sp. SD287 TaxID=2782008 RepID=UPI001A960409|nr:P-II family nitrogen regulator [Tessaracoccus sp. SD287]MBO1031283.1 P-II family nitrogen regulator [Tessaracoccus sp. SD287]
MKLVTAIIQPAVLAGVQIALAQYGIRGMTVTEVSGYARQRGHTEVYRGAEFTIDFIEKVKIEILLEDNEADAVVDVIVDHARSGSVGDGKVWVTPVDHVVRIRTGEVDALAV